MTDTKVYYDGYYDDCQVNYQSEYENEFDANAYARDEEYPSDEDGEFEYENEASGDVEEDVSQEDSFEESVVSQNTDEFIDGAIRKKFNEYDFKKIMEDYHSGNAKRQNKAKEDAIYALEGVVRSIIKKRYHTYTKQHYYDLDQSGKLGILKAMERFDASRGAASTFFYSYIVHEMQMFIDSFVNKTTPHYSSNIRKIKKAIAAISKRKDTYSAVDIAQETNLTMETVEQTLAIINSTEEVHYDNCTDSYLNSNIDVGKRAQTPEEEVVKQEESQSIEDALAKLPSIQKSVIMLSFGINEDKEFSHKEISKTLGIPVDKVKKAYADGLRALRRSNLSTIFHDYIAHDEIRASKSEIAMTGITDIFNPIPNDVDFEGDFTDC